MSDEGTRQLVDSGLAILISNPRQLLQRGLNIEQAFQDSDVSRATFYRRFPNKENFLAAVVNALIRTNRFDTSAARSIAERTWSDQGEDLQQSIRTLIEHGWVAAEKSDLVPRQLLATLFGRSNAQNRADLQHSYEVRDRAATAMFDALIGTTGATLRKPFTVQSLSTALTAIADGFLLRAAVDSRSTLSSLLTDVVLAFTNAVLTPVHDHGHLYGTLAALNPPEPSGNVPRDPRAALIDSARAEFLRSGYFGATYESITVNARVPLHTARRIFPTKTHIIAGALKPDYERLRTAIDDDLVIELDEVDILKNHFIRCAHLAADERAFMDALVAAVAHDTYSEPDGLLAIKEALNLPALIVPAIASGQKKGRINAAYPPFELAAMMTNTLLLRCFTRRDVPPEDNAAIVSDLMIDGKFAPTRS
ncbi:TetR/AcrR family transcriptional regulator [Smaragdicoccus niigatensis]|uniref:TetR/AcrR family transcriptional regulator n=1 Tax=Smaragdicoccus niigatensis TaxID=359359 RepID=UPI00035ECAD3|nr:TetR/AcrR family transcriptional regulator [Smaragdicoccus niigatensis]